MDIAGHGGFKGPNVNVTSGSRRFFLPTRPVPLRSRCPHLRHLQARSNKHNYITLYALRKSEGLGAELRGARRRSTELGRAAGW